MQKEKIPAPDHDYRLNCFIIINIYDLKKIPLIEMDQNSDRTFTKIRNHMKDVTNYGYDNGILAISNIYGRIFSFSVAKCHSKDGDYWSINAWDQVGTHALYSYSMPFVNESDVIPLVQHRRLKKAIENYSEGNVHCSDCSCLMPASRHHRFNPKFHAEDYGGQYFAGHYCKKCWERKWKAVEASENYN